MYGEVGGDESKPDDHSAVHTERDELGLVEVVRKLACLESAKDTCDENNEVVNKRSDERPTWKVALENHDVYLALRNDNRRGLL